MLSCLVPRFGQENTIMPSSSAFSLQIPSLPSNISREDENSSTSHHPDYNFIKCPHCSQNFSEFGSLKDHIDNVHAIGKMYSDEHSEHAGTPSPPISHGNFSHSMMYKSSDDMGRSMSPGSSIDGQYSCSQCTSMFTSRDQLEKHELLHSPNSTVNCKICHKTFANVYRLQRHMISHDESVQMRKFKCEDCPKAFKFKHHLKEHLRIHSGEKPFGCNNCGKRFSHSGSYSSHMTSKKCISMGLKLANGRSVVGNAMSDKLSQQLKRGGYMSPQMQGLAGLTASLGHSNMTNAAVPTMSPNNNNNNNNSNNINNNNNSQASSYLPMLHKYNGYEAINAAFLASFQNPYYSMTAAMDPRAAINPYSLQRFLELTAANAASQNTTLDILKSANAVTIGNKTPSLQSDPEDMIEEVTEEDEPNKLVMDLDEEDEEPKKSDEPEAKIPEMIKQTVTNHASPRKDSHFNSLLSVTQRLMQANLMKLGSAAAEASFMQPIERPSSAASQHQDINVDVDDDHNVEQFTEQTSSNDFLKCSRCGKTFNHLTELNQHEKVLCGMIEKQENLDLIPVNGTYSTVSGSDDECDDANKLSNDAERKVRVRTSISEEQQSVLKDHYAINPRPNREEFRSIAQRLMLDARVVQVWFQNNRSRERKMNGTHFLKRPYALPETSATPTPTPVSVNTQEDQPLDLSFKKDAIDLSPASSPRYGTAPQQNDAMKNEVMNLSKRSSHHSPTPDRPNNKHLFYNGASFMDRPAESSTYIRHTPSPSEAVPRQYNPLVLPTSSLNFIPMERLLQMTPEMARNPLLKMESLSPGSEKRSWRGDESHSSHDDELLHLSKKVKHEQEIEGQFICDQCDKAFSKQSSLARHKYEHSGQRPYKCVDCPKAFKHKHHLTEHKRLHSGEKPFQCCKCLKRFSHSGSYSQHMNHRYSYCKPYRE